MYCRCWVGGVNGFHDLGCPALDDDPIAALVDWEQGVQDVSARKCLLEGGNEYYRAGVGWAQEEMGQSESF